MISPSAKLRWGILGAARIAKKNWRAIGLASNSTVTAVACRDPERNRRFIAECQAEVAMDVLPTAFDSYESLLASDQVDAVYIPLPTGLRKEWVLRAAAAGTHVLCEKPCATSTADLEEMIAACRKNKLQFMDGVMFMHNPRLAWFRARLDDQANFGRVTRIDSALCFSPPPAFYTQDIRVDSRYEPQGCLGDTGWYTIRLSLWAMNWQMPTEVSGRFLAQAQRPDSPAPVPSDFSGELRFAGGASAGFHCSFYAARQNWGVISGTKDYLSIPDFVIPIGDDAKGTPDSQQVHMVRNFTNLARSGAPSDFWPDIALQTQRVMMACDEAARTGKSVAVSGG